MCAPRHSRKQVAWGLTALLAALAAGATWWLSRPIPPLVTRLTLPEGQKLTAGVPFAIAPDGRTLVYSAESVSGGAPRLHARAFDERRTTALEGTEGAINPFFSPSGQWVGFFANDGLHKVSLHGGQPTLLCDAPGPGSASWYADDSIVFASRTGLHRVSSNGGPIERLATGDAIHLHPDAIAHGKVILYTSADRTIRAYVPDTGKHRILTNGERARHLPTGHLIVARESTLLAAPFDVESLEIRGELVRVHSGVRYIHSTSQFQISNGGVLAYVHESVGEEDIELVIVDRDGEEHPFGGELRRAYRDPRLSPDESRVAAESGSDIWVVDVAGGTSTRLTHKGRNTRPIWSPDGRRILFASSRRGGTYRVFSKAADGSDEAIQLTAGAHRVPTSITSDGTRLIFQEFREDSYDIGVIELGMEGPAEPRTLLDSPFNEHSGVLSPDDHWLAYVSDDSGREEVYVTSFPESSDRTQVSTEGGAEPVWSRDGAELFYRNGRDIMMVAIEEGPGPQLRPGRPRVLFERPYGSGTGLISNPGSSYDVIADGRFVMFRNVETAAASRIHVVLNWLRQLDRLVP